MDNIWFGNFKGGVGKTTTLVQLGWRSLETKRRVLVADTDQQADAFAHFSGCDDPEPGAVFKWGDGCDVVWWPDATTAPRVTDYDLVLWDLPPKVGIPSGLGVTGVVVPIDGPFAMKNAADFIGNLKSPCILVANGLSEGGRAFERALRESFKSVPPHVMVCPIDLLRGGSVRRSADAGRPAWQDMYAGQAGQRMREWADWMLSEGVAWFHSKKAA